jgi:predicted nucleic acid-binding protein
VILLDSNVVIDLMGSDATWREWSSNAVANAGAVGELAVSPIVVAEVAPRLGSLEGFVERLSRFGATIVELSNEAAFAAGAAFNIYRERRRRTGAVGRSVLPDFLIGGQALTVSATVLTRDPRFYRAYFPTVPLITPDTTAA